MDTKNHSNHQSYIVTGAAGFVGSFLARHLLRSRGLKPSQLLLVDFDDAFRTRECTKVMRERWGLKCLSPEDLLASMNQGGLTGKVAGVFHMGASSSTEEMRVDFLKKWNIEYSQAVWRFCTTHQVPLVYASSAATYGDGALGFDDSPELFTQLKPLNPYGNSKRLFDIWAEQESRAGRHPPQWAGLRFFNVYGPGEDHKGSQASVVIHARKQITTTGRLKLFESHREGIEHGHQKRDFVYVGDVAQVCEFFGFEKSLSNGVFNVGTGVARTFLDLGRACFQVLNKPELIDFIPTPEKLRDHYQYFTQAKIQRLRDAGYAHEFLDLEAGVQKTILDEHLR